MELRFAQFLFEGCQHCVDRLARQVADEGTNDWPKADWNVAGKGDGAAFHDGASIGGVGGPISIDAPQEATVIAYGKLGLMGLIRIVDFGDFGAVGPKQLIAADSF